MADVQRGFTYAADGQVTNTNLHQLVDDATVSNIVNADIDSSAGIADSKLAQITSASKVHGSSLTGLSSTPSGAGVLPSANYAGGVLGSFKNLQVLRTSVTVCTITCDELVLEDSSNNKVSVRSVNETATITVSGAGGLDTGAEASNTIYYLWIIRKSSDGTTDALISASSSSPTMPSGYDQKALVSVVGNNNSSDFIDFRQNGRRYSFVQWPTIASGNTASAWVAIDLTPATLTYFVPPALSTFCYGVVQGDGGITSVGNDNTVVAMNTDARNKFSQSTTTNAHLAYWQLDIITSDTIYWASLNGTSLIRLHGFELNRL